ncbi:transporter, cation channel family protein [Opisthorchis viverrini]|uniref:Uncharacterized protein n=2 Tax=Opisthorchis viverrini TaxID=6198 RepID=A0A074ZMZ5_OPIVI|nr:hypothetical protein T265_05744 [Opisthorchis viverrini]KER27122.1 hypothetical protein T265_05744 [Opisthorchis viverrini]OON22748.1 transporter, cation channel family protein [Opisthorchis viverrini]
MEPEEEVTGKARRFVLGSTLMRDACVSRLEIDYKRDLESVKKYELFYRKFGVALYYFFTLVNLFTIILEYPASILVNGKPLPYYVPLIINFICEAYFYYRWFLIYSMSEKGGLRDNLSSKMTISILVLMSLDAIIFIICQQLKIPFAIRWSRFLRPILLLTFPENRRLRAAFSSLRSTAIDVFPVFGLFMCTVAFAAIVALTTISGTGVTYPNGKPYFYDFPEAYWDLYVLTTTANSPDVIIPAYEYSRIYISVYVFVCTVCNWLFMGILTASVYNSYKAHLGEFVVKTVAKRKRKLDEAFYHIATPTPTGDPGVSQKTFLRLMHIVKPRRSEDSMRVIFHVLNKSRSGYLNINEFGRLSEYMQVKLFEVELSREYFQTYLPKFYYLFMSPPFQRFKRFAEHRVVRSFFISLVVANGLTAVMCRGYESIQDVVEWFFTIIFFLELIMNYLACGGVRFFSDGWNIFDCLVVMGAMIGQLLQLILVNVGVHIPAGVTQLLLLLRLLRLLKVFSAIPNFKVVINCILTILPSLAAYTTMLLILFYIYACFAMEMFAFLYRPPEGHNYTVNTDCENKKLLDTEFVSWHYCLFNFNSITESYVLLLALVVGNNWHVFTDGLVMVTSRWTRLFFLLIHWSCVLLVLNVVLAFIIEAFLIEFDAQRSKFEAYIVERLEELEMHAPTELKKKGIKDFRKQGFQITRTQLDIAFPPDGSRAKAFFLVEDNASIEILMFRMFETEVEEMMENYRSSIKQQRFKTHDTLRQFS